MKRTSLVLMILIITAIFSISPGWALESPSVEVTPVKEIISVLPGSVVSVPVRVSNLNNQSLANFTLSLLWPTDSGTYEVNKTLSLGPFESTVVDLNINVPFLPPGKYTARLIGKYGNFSDERNVTIKVEKLVQYSLSTDAENSYYYGRDISIHVSVTSYSNDVISGSVRISLLQDGKAIMVYPAEISLQPGETWVHKLVISEPKVGNYSLIVSANLSGVPKDLIKNFKVLPRQFSYSVEFKNGKIVAFVTFANGTPAEGIPVFINGTTIFTDETGRAVFVPEKQGTYVVKLDLDGVIKEEVIRVKWRYTYDLWYEDGRIKAKVLFENGTPAQGILVEIDGHNLTTDQNGLVSLQVDKPGDRKSVV